MWKALRSGSILIITVLFFAFAISSCSTLQNDYQYNFFMGRNAVYDGEYAAAERFFSRAAMGKADDELLAFQAVVSYKKNDIAGAARLVEEARRKLSWSDRYYLRVLGYQALVLLKQQRNEEGLRALREYLSYYAYHYPLTTIVDVQAMADRGKVDLPLLEGLIEEQVSWYERELEQYEKFNSGYYDKFSDRL